jgi:glutaredoxin 3
MAKVEIYTGPYCGYCHRARKLLDSKGIPYSEYSTFMDADRRTEMVRRAGGRSSVPQIFIDGRHVGGCDDLFALDAKGRLDTMLEA